MPRKSNKTSHVLNLLSGESPTDGEIVQKETNEKVTVSEVVDEPKSTEPLAPEITIEKQLTAADDSLSDLIKENLESELDDSSLVSAATNDNSSKEASASAKDLESIKEKEILQETIATEEPAPIAESVKSVDVPDSNVNAPVKSPIVLEDSVIEEYNSHTLSYAYTNVMEHIVKERILGFMEQFEMCTCDRCIVDTTALALTQLTAKYIVADKSAVSPLLNFYSNKYIGDVVVALTKACTLVKDHPRH